MNVVEPSTEILNKINSIIFYFLWGSKSDKVKRQTMIAEYNQGGLKAPDIHIIIKVQRIMWVVRYFMTTDHPWKAIFEWQLDKVGGRQILENSNLSLAAIEKSDLLPFYKNMIKCWGEWSKKEIDSSNFQGQNLYFNSLFIKPDGESFFYKQLSSKGINKVCDLTIENRFITFDQAVTKYNLNPSDAIQFASVIQCISKYSAMLDDTTTHPIRDNFPGIENLNSRKVSSTLRKQFAERPSSEVKLENDFGICHNMWENIYTVPFISTIETKLRAFQFKINHNIFYTNEKMARANMEVVSDLGVSEKVSSLCTFCKEEVETLRHIFIECKAVQPLWSQLEKHINYQFSDVEKIFGCFSKTNDRSFDIISHLTIIVKYYIHLCRLKKNTPHYQVLMKKITATESIEMKIAVKSNKINQHLKKWSNVITRFSL